MLDNHTRSQVMTHDGRDFCRIVKKYFYTSKGNVKIFPPRLSKFSYKIWRSGIFLMKLHKEDLQYIVSAHQQQTGCSKFQKIFSPKAFWQNCKTLRLIKAVQGIMNCRASLKLEWSERQVVSVGKGGPIIIPGTSNDCIFIRTFLAKTFQR